MKAIALAAVLMFGGWLVLPFTAQAADNDSFGLGLMLGDSYTPNHFRLSIGSFDIGYADKASVYAGSRRWMGPYYAGFGLGVQGAVYGMVGYEWRFVEWMGLMAEFDGIMTAKGESDGRVYIGVVAGW